MEFSIWGGTQKWMVDYFMENSIYKWMIWGSPMTSDTSINRQIMVNQSSCIIIHIFHSICNQCVADLTVIRHDLTFEGIFQCLDVWKHAILPVALEIDIHISSYFTMGWNNGKRAKQASESQLDYVDYWTIIIILSKNMEATLSERNYLVAEFI